MKKGRFGIVLCFYPIAAFACVILKAPVLCAILLALAVFLERDEWAGRQTMQALMASLLAALFDDVFPWLVSLLPGSFFARALGVVATVLNVLVYIAAIVFSIIGILRVMKDQEADVPVLSDLAYRAYGKRKPRPIRYYQPPVAPYPPQGVPQQPYPQQPAPPYQQPVQPAPPQQPCQPAPYQAEPPMGQPGTGQSRTEQSQTEQTQTEDPAPAEQPPQTPEE